MRHQSCADGMMLTVIKNIVRADRRRRDIHALFFDEEAVKKRDAK